MKICYFGDYDPHYSRTRVILRGLEVQGVEVVHVNIRERGIMTLIRLWSDLRALQNSFDLVFIPTSNTRVLSLVAQLATSRPVVWEPMYSLYDNWVYDRKLTSPYSIKATYYWFLDLIGSLSSDLILLDTATNAEYFHTTFGVPRKKLDHVFIGADNAIFSPIDLKKEEGVFEVEFHGRYIPVQGADVIIHAAKELEGEPVHFTMIGSGQTLIEIKNLARELRVQNVTFFPLLSQAEVVNYIAAADVCIGLIGDVPRVNRAIPNKLYEAAAMAKMTINADTPALREVFTPDEDVIAIRPGDHRELASVIRELISNPQKVRRIGERAHARYLEIATPNKVGEQLVHAVRRLFAAQG